MVLGKVSFPVDLGTWRLQGPAKCADRSTDIRADYYYRDGDGFYAGGFGFMVIGDKSDDAAGRSWRVWWVSPQEFALQDPDTSWYVWESGGHYGGVAGLSDGSRDDQQPNRHYDPNGRFTLQSAGGGTIGIKHGGKFAACNYDSNWAADWEFFTVEFLNGDFGNWQRLKIVAGSVFPVLLLTQSGVGLPLAGQDLAQGGYLTAVSGVDFTGADLQRASFAHLPDPSLAGCHFNGAKLGGAILDGCADLNQAHFASADLTGTDLSRISPGLSWHGWDVGFDGAPKMATLSAATGRQLNHTELFGITADGALVHDWQDASGGWHGWQTGWYGLSSAAAVTAVVGPTGHVEVFTVGADGTLSHISQDASGYWDDSWAADFDKAPQKMQYVMAAVGPADLEVFAIGLDGSLYHDYQTPTSVKGDWHGWAADFQQAPKMRSVTAAMGPQHLEAFAIGVDGTVYHNYNDGSWHDWTPDFAGAPKATLVSARLGAGGHVEVFLVGTDGTVSHNYFDGSWHDWTPNFDNAPKAKIVHQELGNAGNLEVFAVAADGTLWHGYQDPGNAWHGWAVFDGAPSKMSFVWSTIGAAGHLEAFAVGRDDGTLYHDWLTGWRDGPTTRACDFTGAILDRATLSNGRGLASNYHYDGSNFAVARLEQANLAGVGLAGANFTGATMQGAILDGADLSGAQLQGADLSGARLDATNFTGAHLHGTRFDGCDLSSTVFGDNPDFSRDSNSRTSFQKVTNLPGASLGRDWSFLDLSGAVLADVPKDLTGLNATETLFPTSVGLAGTILTGARLDGARMYKADLRGSDLGGATMARVLAKGARLDGANLSGASLKGAWLIAETGTEEAGSKPEPAQLVGAFLINADLDQAQCDGVDFSSAVFITDGNGIQGATAKDASMNRVTFVDAKVVAVDFSRTKLEGAHFDGAQLVGSTFAACDMSPTADSVHSGATMTKADIRGAQFAVATHSGTSQPANMDGVDMRGCAHSTAHGTAQVDYRDFGSTECQQMPVDYGPTVLGTTTQSTICPSGCEGPCTLG